MTMTAAPHSIDPATYLDDLLAQASPDLMRQMLQGFINQILSAQADTVCGAEYGVAPTERVNHRNGYRHRDLDTRVGTIDVAVPKLRHGAIFPDWLLERRSRAERASSTVIATCYLKGVSTRRMNDLVATLGITNMSKSQVSRMAEELDEMVADFKNRPLDPGGYAYMSCDALTIKVREGTPGGQMLRTFGHRGQRRRLPGDARYACRHRRFQRVVERLLPRLKSPRAARRLPRHQ